MKVHIESNIKKDPNAKVALITAKELIKYGVEVFFSNELCSVLEADFCKNIDGVHILPKIDCYDNADVIITIGGDGTILREAISYLDYQKPILGVNLGRCGFLATCETDELSEKLMRLAKKDYKLDERALLHVDIKEKKWKAHALNDVVIAKGNFQQTIDLKIACDEISVEQYRGDGVIVATPTGSTAYSLAAGGPVVDVQAKTMILTPVCSHTLHVPAIVFAANRRLSIQAKQVRHEEIYLSCDGSNGVLLSNDDLVEIYLSEQKVSLITFGKGDQFHAIDNKLKYRI